MPGSRWLLAAVLALLFSAAMLVVAPRMKAAPPPRAARAAAGQAVAVDNGERRLVFHLSDATGAPPSTKPEEPARTTALTKAESDALFAGVAPIAAEPADETSFSLRDKSLPPPRTGKTITEAFPPNPIVAPPPPLAPTGPLTIARRSPEGAVELAPNVSIAFSQPMVPLTSVDESEGGNVPVTLTPQPSGAWRWLSAQILSFAPVTRLPMATDYQVDIPAGTASLAGDRLAKAEHWTFSTPPPTLQDHHPGDGQVTRLAPAMFAVFDQKIDPAAVLRSITVKAGTASPRLVLLTPDDVKADKDIAQLAASAPAGQWLAFRAEQPLPANTAVTVTVGPGTPSLEGPKTTTKPQSWTFHTFGPLRVTGHACGWNNQCPPSTPWRISFSNPLDEDAFSASMLSVQPSIRGMKVTAHGSSLTIEGQTRGRTTYTVAFSPGIKDVFGQALGTSASVTFNVEAGSPFLSSLGGDMVVLDPAANLRFPVYSRNYATLNVEMRVVTPEDWTSDWHAGKVLPGRVAFSKTVATNAAPEEVAETLVDIGTVLPKQVGQVLLSVKPGAPIKGTPNAPRPNPASAPDSVLVWIQATHIALDAFVDDEDLVAWASSLGNGKPVSAARLSLLPGGAAETTTADGVVRMPLNDKGDALLVARLGDDSAFLPASPRYRPFTARRGLSRPEPSWRRQPQSRSLLWHVFDGRGLYRPGEDVKVKGWIRVGTSGKRGGVVPVAGEARSIAYVLRDSRGNEIGKGTTTLNEYGGFDLTMKLPATPNLGFADLMLTADAAATINQRVYPHRFRIEEFRRPEFEVATTVGEPTHVVGGFATVAVEAKYFTGSSVPLTPVTWTVRSLPGHFAPPNRRDFSFGRSIPWWSSSNERADWQPRTFSARTDGSGRHVLRIDFDEIDPPLPMSVVAEATITDVNRQAWTSQAQLLVHPATVYVGLKTDRYFVEGGSPLPVDLIVTDFDGRAVAGRPVHVKAEHVDWKRAHGEWREEVLDTQEFDVTSAAETSRVIVATKEGGRYRITAIVRDASGRPNETEISRWVTGGRPRTASKLEQERVELIPDKESYRAGDTAQILVLPPFTPAEGLLTLRRSGVLRTERFTIDGASYTLKVPLEEQWAPDVHVQVDLVGSSTRANDAGDPDPKLPKRPAFASGSLTLDIPPTAHALTVAAVPRAGVLRPGGDASIDLTLSDAQHKPVAGEVAVVVIDEAVLALSGYKLADPVASFYAQRGEGVSDWYLRERVLLSRPEDVKELDAGAGRGFGGGGGVAGSMAAPMMRAAMAPPSPGGAEPPRVRTDFNALALFAASVVTDAAGRASVQFKLPDNLTRYRVMAVAASKAVEFGSTSEATITARLPLMVRPSPPRFLNVGDRLDLPVVVQNQADAPVSVGVALRATNADVTGAAGVRVQVPANDRVEVRFPIAAHRPGTARFQVVASSGSAADANEFALPVWTPATTEAFATYGQIDDGAVAQRVKAPADASPEYGGLQISTSSTSLQALTDAVLYLVSYPYECAEQISSRVMAVAALKDVLSAFKAPGLPDEQTLRDSVDRDVKRLAALQSSGGEVGLWNRGDSSWPFLSVHVAHTFVRAKAKGFAVPDQALRSSRDYLRNIENHIPSAYGVDARRAIIAYALYVRKLEGDGDPGRARDLLRQAGGPRGVSFEALGWLLSSLAGDANSTAELTAIRTHLANHVAETAGTAHFAVSYADEQGYLLFESSRRADAVLVDALIADQPKSDLIPKIVEGLLAHRRAGRWENTQENVFALLALDRYFNTYENVTPDFVARAWLGDAYAGEHAFRGRTTDRHEIRVPMSVLANPNPSSGGEAKPAADASAGQIVTLAKEGPGRLYYRLGLEYAPRSLDLKPLERGLAVQRTYQAVDDKADVERDNDGVWHIRAGARVRVKLSLGVPARRYFVALVDPLPAGFEAVNPALQGSGTMPTESADETGRGTTPWWWRARWWFDHQNLRDDRVEAFASILYADVYSYSYIARATTPGQFVVPPPRAEEMYHPDTFGRGATDRVVIAGR